MTVFNKRFEEFRQEMKEEFSCISIDMTGLLEKVKADYLIFRKPLSRQNIKVVLFILFELRLKREIHDLASNKNLEHLNEYLRVNERIEQLKKKRHSGHAHVTYSSIVTEIIEEAKLFDKRKLVIPEDVRIRYHLSKFANIPSRIKELITSSTLRLRESSTLNLKEPWLISVLGAVINITSKLNSIKLTQKEIGERLKVDALSIRTIRRRIEKRFSLNLKKPASYSDKEVKEWKELYEKLGSFSRVEKFLIKKDTLSNASKVTIIARLRKLFEEQFNEWMHEHQKAKKLVIH